MILMLRFMYCEGRVKPSGLKAITEITPVMLHCNQSGLRVASFLPAWKKPLISACAVGAVEPGPPPAPMLRAASELASCRSAPAGHGFHLFWKQQTLLPSQDLVLTPCLTKLING